MHDRTSSFDAVRSVRLQVANSSRRPDRILPCLIWADLRWARLACKFLYNGPMLIFVLVLILKDSVQSYFTINTRCSSSRCHTPAATCGQACHWLPREAIISYACPPHPIRISSAALRRSSKQAHLPTSMSSGLSSLLYSQCCFSLLTLACWCARLYC